jgi:hypothetical protein
MLKDIFDDFLILNKADYPRLPLVFGGGKEINLADLLNESGTLFSVFFG